jgi:hypothetical protein
MITLKDAQSTMMQSESTNFQSPTQSAERSQTREPIAIQCNTGKLNHQLISHQKGEMKPG